MRCPIVSNPRTAAISFVAMASLATCSLAALGTRLIFAEFKTDPSAQSIKDWVEVVCWIAGAALLMIRLRKETRPEPSNEKKYATKEEVARVDDDSKRRDAEHDDELKRIEGAFDRKHAENVEKLDDLQTTLIGNREADHKERVKLREDVRHDVREVISPVQNNITAHAQDAEKEFRGLAKEIGGLKADATNTATTLVSMRQTLETLLSRTAPNRGGNQG